MPADFWSHIAGTTARDDAMGRPPFLSPSQIDEREYARFFAQRPINTPTSTPDLTRPSSTSLGSISTNLTGSTIGALPASLTGSTIGAVPASLTGTSIRPFGY